MSVIVTIVVQGDPGGVERYAAENPGALDDILAHAEQHGLIAHRFYGSEGKIMVVDEWPDAESFQEFFTHMQPQIEPVMVATGAQGEPTVTFWRKLETNDDYGWE